MKKISVLSLVALLLLVALPAAAQDGPATRHLRARHDDVMRIMRRTATTDADRQRRTAEVREILGQVLDYQEMSRRALAQHWDSHTPEQRTRFVELLRQLIERNYETNMERILEAEVSYSGEAAGPDGTVVTTQARSRTERRQPPIDIQYTLRQVDGQWRVVDVVTDNSPSLVSTYRRQFNNIITQHGWDDLIRRMEERLAAGR